MDQLPIHHGQPGFRQSGQPTKHDDPKDGCTCTREPVPDNLLPPLPSAKSLDANPLVLEK